MKLYGIIHVSGEWAKMHNGIIWTGDLEAACLAWVDLMAVTNDMGWKLKPITEEGGE